MSQKTFTTVLNCPTVSEWFYSEYCNYKGNKISKISSLTINSVFSNRIKPYIGEKKLKDVTFQDCYNILMNLKEQGAGHGTLFGTYSVLTRIFRSALFNNIICKDEYPCVGLRSLTF